MRRLILFWGWNEIHINIIDRIAKDMQCDCVLAGKMLRPLVGHNIFQVKKGIQMQSHFIVKSLEALQYVPFKSL